MIIVDFGLILLLLIGFIVAILSTIHENILGVIAAAVIIALSGWYFYGIDYTSVPLIYYVMTFFGYFIFNGLYTLFVMWPRYLKEHSLAIIGDYENWQEDTYPGKALNFYDTPRYKEKWSAKANTSRIVNYICTGFFDFIWCVVKNPIIWTYNLVYNTLYLGYNKIGIRTTDNILNKRNK